MTAKSISTHTEKESQPWIAWLTIESSNILPIPEKNLKA